MPKNRYSIDLIKQMAECDANYIRLLRLMPVLAAHRQRDFASLGVDNAAQAEKALEGMRTVFTLADLATEPVTVEITVLEAFKYTTTLEIVQRPVLREWMTNPSMLIRVYHDASTAEVVSYQGHKNLQVRYPQPNAKMYQSDEKGQVNQFLGEWLSHCLTVGRAPRLSGLATQRPPPNGRVAHLHRLSIYRLASQRRPRRLHAGREHH